LAPVRLRTGWVRLARAGGPGAAAPSVPVRRSASCVAADAGDRLVLRSSTVPVRRSASSPAADDRAGVALCSSRALARPGVAPGPRPARAAVVLGFRTGPTMRPSGAAVAHGRVRSATAVDRVR